MMFLHIMFKLDISTRYDRDLDVSEALKRV